MEPMVTDSKFFSRDFNTAIIDGPLRIYFSNDHEERALEIYFSIQDDLKKLGISLRKLPAQMGSAFLMLYPNRESFEKVFNRKDSGTWDRWGDHHVVGIDVSDQDGAATALSSIYKKVGQIFSLALRTA